MSGSLEHVDVKFSSMTDQFVVDGITNRSTRNAND